MATRKKAKSKPKGKSKAKTKPSRGRAAAAVRKAPTRRKPLKKAVKAAKKKPVKKAARRTPPKKAQTAVKRPAPKAKPEPVVAEIAPAKRAAKPKPSAPVARAPKRPAKPRPAPKPAAITEETAPPQPAVEVKESPVVEAAVESPVSGERVGVVTHYFNHLGVAAITMESGSLRVGDTVRIKGHTTDFTQTIESLEVNHEHVNEVSSNDNFGMKVVDHARDHDVVYKI